MENIRNTLFELRFTYNKALQKMIESDRIDNMSKRKLKEMKRG